MHVIKGNPSNKCCDIAPKTEMPNIIMTLKEQPGNQPKTKKQKNKTHSFTMGNHKITFLAIHTTAEIL